MSHSQVVREFTEVVARCSQGDKWLTGNRPRISSYQSGRPFQMCLDSDFIESFKEAYLEVRATELPVVGSPSGCDSRIWKNIAGCPTVQYGPGRLEQCHAVNEHIDVEQYFDAILIYAQLILNWCSKNKEE